MDMEILNLKVNAVRNIAGQEPAFGIDDDNVITYWQGDTAQPSQSAINTEVARLQAEYDAQEYARKRKAKYDALNQFELISDDAINGTTTHKDAIVAIKSEFPKP